MTRPLPLAALALALTTAWTACNTAQADARYRVGVPDALDRLEISACFDESMPATLSPSSQQAGALLSELRSDAAVQLTRRGNRITIEGDHEPGCLAYRVDLSAAQNKGHWRRDFVRQQHALLVSPGLFLWLPEGTVDVAVEFELPEGYRVSAPWEKHATRPGAHGFRTGPRAADWTAKIALGRFDLRQLSFPGTDLEIALLHGQPAANTQQILNWLTRNIEAVAAIYGRFPVPRAQILVVPVGHGGEPVPWGQVARGGGESVHLYVDQHLSERAFLNDWVLSHELSHLLHPVLREDARWIYEGLASYYQNVSRARTGMIPARDAWESLHAGFERGKAGVRPGRDLLDASRNMMRERAFMRVYWSGAAVFLLADLELRQRGRGATSLDSVLQRLRDCCLPSQRIWTASELLQRLDRLSESDVFTRLARQYLHSDRFPDLQAAYTTLGLVRESPTALAFRQQPAQRALRAAIMGTP